MAKYVSLNAQIPFLVIFMMPWTCFDTLHKVLYHINI